jgi:hypothetical protein
VKTLTCWFTHREPWEAPELPPHIVGRLDGHQVMTSRVVFSSGREVTTESGSIYHLADVDPAFQSWLEEHGYEFDPENPIKRVKKPTILPPPATDSNGEQRTTEGLRK